jgi:hypothetical protein
MIVDYSVITSHYLVPPIIPGFVGGCLYFRESLRVFWMERAFRRVTAPTVVLEEGESAPAVVSSGVVAAVVVAVLPFTRPPLVAIRSCRHAKTRPSFGQV